MALATGTRQGHRTMHPNSLANLRRLPKGVSPNPGGMPKGTFSLTTHLRRFMALPPAEKAKLLALDPSQLTFAEEQVLTTIRNALAVESGRRGTSASEQIVWDRVDGRVPSTEREQYGGDVHYHIHVGSGEARAMTERILGGEGTAGQVAAVGRPVISVETSAKEET